MQTQGWLGKHLISVGNHDAKRNDLQLLQTSQVFTSGYLNTETILYFFYKTTNRRIRKCFEILLVYYIDKDLNSPENLHDPIGFARLKLPLEQCRASSCRND